jgi:hypothetical protein
MTTYSDAPIDPELEPEVAALYERLQAGSQPGKTIGVKRSPLIVNFAVAHCRVCPFVVRDTKHGPENVVQSARKHVLDHGHVVGLSAEHVSFHYEPIDWDDEL